jgi:putative transposase
MLRHQYPVRHVCRVLGAARSHDYDRPQPCDETARKAAVERLAGQWLTDGDRRSTALWRREDFQVNHKPVARLMRALGLQGQRPARQPRTTCSHHGAPRYQNWVHGLTMVRPDHVWIADLTSIRLPEAFVYLAVLMDVYPRRIRGWHLRRHLDQTLTLTALQRALAPHRPEIHPSDQGVQYAATLYTQTRQAHGVQISMATIGAAPENGYAERLMRPLKEEEVTLHD